MADPAGRFQLTQAPTMSPATCWVTRSDKGPFIDTGVDVKFAAVGRLYLSVDALREMAEVAGILGEEKSQSVQVRETEWFNAGYDKAVKENIGGQLRDLVDRLDTAAGRFVGSPFVGDVQVIVESAPAADRADDDDAPGGFVVDDESPHQRDGVADSSGGQSDGPDADDRPPVVPAGAGDDNPFRI